MGISMENTENTQDIETMQQPDGVKKRKLLNTLPVLYIRTFVLIFGGQIVGSILINLLYVAVLHLNSNAAESAAFLTALTYVLFIGIWILAIVAFLLIKPDRDILQYLGTKPSGNNWKGLLFGLLIGFVLNGVCILGAWLNQDIRLTFDSFHPVSFLAVFLCVFVQSSAEEMLCRGFLYQKLRQNYRHPAVAIIGSSLLFALLHLMNDGVTFLSLLNLFLTGILFAFVVYYMDSLWCAFAVHTAWNFTQNILFGLPNSGIVVPYSVFKLDAASARNSFAYDVGFGIEGTVLSVIVLIIACTLIYLWGRKHKAANG